MIPTQMFSPILLPYHGEPCSPAGGSQEVDCTSGRRHTCEAVCPEIESPRVSF